MESLIIVDRQKDFGNKFGALYVPGAEETEANTVIYIEKNHLRIAEVIFTVDWHTSKHCSFKSNGGIWPNHCQQFSEGAGISDALYNVCVKYNIPIKVFKKGNIDEIEEYGAFEHMRHYTSSSNGKDYVILKNVAENSSVTLGCFDLVVCGLAGDYCVQETIKNLIRHSGNPVEFNISVFKNGTSSIDGGKSFDEFIKANNLKVVE